MRRLIFSLLPALFFTASTAHPETVYLERERRGMGEYVRVIGELTPEILDTVLPVLQIQQMYRPSGNFCFGNKASIGYLKQRKIFTDHKYGDCKYRLPVQIKDLSGHGCEEYRVTISLADYLSFDMTEDSAPAGSERGNGHITVVDERGKEIGSEFNQGHQTLSFITTLAGNASKLYYLYFGKEDRDEKKDDSTVMQKAEPEQMLPSTIQDEEPMAITMNDKYGFSWWVKMLKEDPFGISFWELGTVPAECDISPIRGKCSYKATLMLNKQDATVDTFDWLVFKAKSNIPIHEDSYLEYDVRGEVMAPELAAGIFCRLHVPLRKVFYRQLFDHVTFDKKERDENGVTARLSTELNYFIDKTWYHRRIPLKEYAGKTIDHLYFKVKGVLENPENAPDTLTYYFDHVRITRGAAPEVIIQELEINREWINR
jgi:hypothetical protein